MAVDIQGIRSLSPSALRIFKEQASLKARQGDQNFARLVSMPELSDIFGSKSLTAVQPESKSNPLKTAVNVATTPLRWIDQNITQPFGAIVTSPFTPDVPGTQGMNWLQKERTQYAQWKEPVLATLPNGYQIRPTKGIVESLPWFALPSAGAVAGKLGALAKVGGAAGKAASIGAKIAEPFAAAEALPGKALGKLTGLVKQAENILPEQKLLTHQERSIRLGKAMSALQKGQGQQAYVDFMRELKGNIPDVAFKPVGDAMTLAEKDELSNLMKNNPLIRGYEHATGNTALTKIYKGELPVESELKVLEKAFGSDLVNELVKKMPLNKFNQAMDIANAPRAVLSAFDMSFPARQGALLFARHPIEQSKTILPMAKAFFSDSNAELVDKIIMGRTNTATAMQYGMEFTPIPSKMSLAIGGREEAFASRIVEKIPGLGSIVKASNRAYVTAANDMRSRAWELAYPEFVKAGGNEADFKGLAGYIMAASGRGNLPKMLKGASPLLNATLFAPKLLWSRGEVVAGLAAKSPLVRKEAVKTILSSLGLGSTLVGLAALGGASVETDPRSPDFGKIKIGETRLDVWSGYSQWARLAAQLTTGEKKTTGGNIREINRLDVADRFLQSKYSPALGLLHDILKGESYMGDEVSLATDSLREQTVNRLAPLFLQDLADAMLQQGAVEGMVALPGFVGVGVTTYMNPVEKMRNELAQNKYGMSWDEVGKNDKLGNAAQRQIENNNPQLTQLAQQESDKYSQSIAGKADPNNRYRIETGLVEDRYQKAIALASQEFRDTGDGTGFREKVNNAAMNRREQYNLVNMNPAYATTVDYYKKPLDQKQINKMSEQDIARRAYNSLMYSDNMYDQYGNYRFDMIDQNRQTFADKFGLAALSYVEDYQNIKAKDMPPEYDMLKQAQGILKPYFDIETQLWNQYPPEIKDSADQIAITERTDKVKARQMLVKYPQIVYIRKMIAIQKNRMKLQNPQIAQALRMFYSY